MFLFSRWDYVFGLVMLGNMSYLILFGGWLYLNEFLYDIWVFESLGSFNGKGFGLFFLYLLFFYIIEIFKLVVKFDW